MAPNRTRIAYLIVASLLVATAGHGMAKVLTPPVVSSEKLVSERHYEKDMLRKFTTVGDWRELNRDNKHFLSGKSTDSSISVKSIDTLSKGPKSFVFSYSVKNTIKAHGFIYGKQGLIVNNGRLYKASFNDDYTEPIDLTNIKRIPYYSEALLSNTVEFSTGYDPLGGTEIQCIIYINGIGESFVCPDTNGHFGVYLAPENEISIGDFRWDTANH